MLKLNNFCNTTNVPSIAKKDTQSPSSGYVWYSQIRTTSTMRKIKMNKKRNIRARVKNVHDDLRIQIKQVWRQYAAFSPSFADFKPIGWTIHLSYLQSSFLVMFLNQDFKMFWNYHHSHHKPHVLVRTVKALAWSIKQRFISFFTSYAVPISI